MLLYSSRTTPVNLLYQNGVDRQRIHRFSVSVPDRTGPRAARLANLRRGHADLDVPPAGRQDLVDRDARVRVDLGGLLGAERHARLDHACIDRRQDGVEHRRLDEPGARLVERDAPRLRQQVNAGQL